MGCDKLPVLIRERNNKCFFIVVISDEDRVYQHGLGRNGISDPNPFFLTCELYFAAGCLPWLADVRPAICERVGGGSRLEELKRYPS